MSVLSSPKDSTTIVFLNLEVRSKIVMNLGREKVSGYATLRITTSEKTKPVTLFLDGLQDDGYGLNVVTALEHGLLQLLDADSKDVIAIPFKDSLLRAWTIKPMEIDELHSLEFHPGDEFWKRLVKSGGTYLIRFSDSGGLSWCQYSPKEEHSIHLLQDLPESLSLQRGPGSVEFSVKDDPPPPAFTASIATSLDICHLSAGSPTFELILSIISHETRPITVAIQDTPLYINQGLDEIFDIEDQNIKQILELPSGVGCFLDNTDSEEFPHALVLQESLPEQPYVRRYGMAPFDPATSHGGEVECLSDGHHYSIRLHENILRGFGSWCWGRESELPGGNPKATRKRMQDNGAIRLIVADEPVSFKAEK